MTETLKTSKSWRNEQNLNHNFVSYSDHTPRCGLRSSHQDAWSCPRPCLVLPGELHMTLVQRHSRYFLLTFRDTLEIKKVNRPKQSKVTAAHCLNVPPAAPAAQQRWMAVSNVAGSRQWITLLEVTTEAEVMPRVKKQGDPAGKNRRKTKQI